ncbi:MAG TPA: extradiol ring-cleavage dioxygenase [Candidatus Limnocylindria bacterium]|nr:extradiol ring-cleavage dioxygenase [Candidatus Limnocylindria bacterium]
MGLAFACIAPHGSMAIAEWCTPEQRPLAARTRAAFEELGRRFDAARPDVTVLLTPHHVHVEGHMAVVTAGAMHGILEGGAGRVELRARVDRELAVAVRDAVAAAGVPIVGLSYGANDTAAAVMPMDWATHVPIHFMGRDRVPIVVLAPARDLSWDRHVAAGRAIASTAASSSKRVALIASCDHGHGHDANGPYGYHPESKVFDDRVVELVKRNALRELLSFEPAFVAAAHADSFWQMLMLHGAIGDRWDAELLSYEAPTYFGMLCAAFTPRDEGLLRPAARRPLGEPLPRDARRAQSAAGWGSPGRGRQPGEPFGPAGRHRVLRAERPAPITRARRSLGGPSFDAPPRL